MLKSRKTAAITLGLVGVAGLSLASAAQLNVSTATLGADTEIVSACDTVGGIGVEFGNEYTTAGYQTEVVTLTEVDATCDGLALAITLADENGVSLGEITGVDAATGTATYELPAGVDAAAVEKVSVIISG